MVAGVVDRAVRLACLRTDGRGDRLGADGRGQPAVGALEGVALQSAARRASERRVLMLGELVEDIGRHDCAKERRLSQDSSRSSLLLAKIPPHSDRVDSRFPSTLVA